MASTTAGTVLVIGGGHPQLCLIEALRHLGEHVTAVDDRPHIPAYQAAQQVIPIHRYDLHAITAHAQAEPPARVASGGSDKAVHIAAHLAQTLGLPSYLSTATAEMPMRKAASRHRLAAAGVACPATVYAADLETFQALDWDRFRFPVVVKPDSGIGQTAVDRAETITQALTSIKAAFNVTGNGRVVVQELVHGDEIGVNGLVLSGTFHLLSTSLRRSCRQRGAAFGVAMDKIYPAITQPGALHTLTATIQRACAALGIDNGPIYAQVIMKPQPAAEPEPQPEAEPEAAAGRQATFTIIEIMPRLGGGEDPRLVYAATGVNLAKATALMWLGRRVVLDELREAPPHPAAILRFLRTAPGRVTTVTGLDQARGVPAIAAADVYVHPGQQVAALSSSRQRTGYILATGHDPATAAATADKAQTMITIRTE